MSKSVDYEGAKVDVRWDGKLCIHVGECGRSECSLFEGGRKPWCDPDQATTDEVVEVVERCPTGALSYTRKDGGDAEAAPSRNTAVVTSRGPIYLRGQLDIAGADEAQTGLNTRAALCRCGQSKNKPFCDNAHIASGFDDQGAVGIMQVNTGAQGGPLTVKSAPNGPLLVSGNLELIAASGRVAWRGSKCALCRCGASKKKPFCDGSHSKIGFVAE